MRKFNEKDIEKWNPRLSKINLGILTDNSGTLQFFHQYSYVGWQGFSNPGYSGERTLIDKLPQIQYHFTYSVSKKSLKRFDNILSILLEDGLSFSISKKSSSLKETISVSKKILDYSNFLEESVIKIHNVEYIQRHYKLDLPISEIFLLVNSIEESVGVISEFYEYEEDGTEICKIKYPVTSIVSTIDDKSGNYIVLSHTFRNDDESIKPIYNIAKIETEIGFEVLIFGETFSVYEHYILPNREDRLNSLLN